MCLHVLNKTQTFLDHKMGYFYKAKIRNFRKGLTRDLDKNIKNFSVFVFCQKSFKKEFLDVLNTKETFLGYWKIGTFHKAKNRNFPKGLTLDFDQKHSKTFVFAFSQNTLKKGFLYVLNKTETFLDRKNGIFP